MAQDITHEHEPPVFEEPTFDKEEQKNWLMCGYAFKEAEIILDEEFDWEFGWEGCKIIIDKIMFDKVYLCEECEEV